MHLDRRRHGKVCSLDHNVRLLALKCRVWQITLCPTLVIVLLMRARKPRGRGPFVAKTCNQLRAVTLVKIAIFREHPRCIAVNRDSVLPGLAKHHILDAVYTCICTCTYIYN